MRWEFDSAHTTAAFSVRHMMISKVRGRFGGVTGAIEWDLDDPAKSSVEAAIDASTIDTREPQRDGHLRSPDFLNVQEHPTITFRSTRVERGKGDSWRLIGDLTIAGNTREVVLAMELVGRIKDMQGVDRAGFSAQTKINRKDWGLIWNVALEVGGWLVGDEVEIDIEVEAVAAVKVAAAA